MTNPSYVATTGLKCRFCSKDLHSAVPAGHCRLELESTRARLGLVADVRRTLSFRLHSLSYDLQNYL